MATSRPTSNLKSDPITLDSAFFHVLEYTSEDSVRGMVSYIPQHLAPGIAKLIRNEVKAEECPRQLEVSILKKIYHALETADITNKFIGQLLPYLTQDHIQTAFLRHINDSYWEALNLLKLCGITPESYITAILTCRDRKDPPSHVNSFIKQYSSPEKLAQLVQQILTLEAKEESLVCDTIKKVMNATPNTKDSFIQELRKLIPQPQADAAFLKRLNDHDAKDMFLRFGISADVIINLIIKYTTVPEFQEIFRNQHYGIKEYALLVKRVLTELKSPQEVKHIITSILDIIRENKESKVFKSEFIGALRSLLSEKERDELFLQHMHDNYWATINILCDVGVSPSVYITAVLDSPNPADFQAYFQKLQNNPQQPSQAQWIDFTKRVLSTNKNVNGLPNNENLTPAQQWAAIVLSIIHATDPQAFAASVTVEEIHTLLINHVNRSYPDHLRPALLAKASSKTLIELIKLTDKDRIDHAKTYLQTFLNQTPSENDFEIMIASLLEKNSFGDWTLINAIIEKIATTKSLQTPFYFNQLGKIAAYATREKQQDIVIKALEANAILHWNYSDNKTPLDLAVSQKNIPMIAAFLKADLKPTPSHEEKKDDQVESKPTRFFKQPVINNILLKFTQNSEILDLCIRHGVSTEALVELFALCHLSNTLANASGWLTRQIAYHPENLNFSTNVARILEKGWVYGEWWIQEIIKNPQLKAANQATLENFLITALKANETGPSSTLLSDPSVTYSAQTLSSALLSAIGFVNIDLTYLLLQRGVVVTPEIIDFAIKNGHYYLAQLLSDPTTREKVIQLKEKYTVKQLNLLYQYLPPEIISDKVDVTAEVAIRYVLNQIQTNTNLEAFKFFIEENQLNVDKAKLKALINTPNESTEHNDTPLHCAVRLKNLELVKGLLAAGANAEAINSLGQKPLNIANERHALVIAELLSAKDAIKFLGQLEKEGASAELEEKLRKNEKTIKRALAGFANAVKDMADFYKDNNDFGRALIFSYLYAVFYATSESEKQTYKKYVEEFDAKKLPTMIVSMQKVKYLKTEDREKLNALQMFLNRNLMILDINLGSEELNKIKEEIVSLDPINRLFYVIQKDKDLNSIERSKVESSIGSILRKDMNIPKPLVEQEIRQRKIAIDNIIHPNLEVELKSEITTFDSIDKKIKAASIGDAHAMRLTADYYQDKEDFGKALLFSFLAVVYSASPSNAKKYSDYLENASLVYTKFLSTFRGNLQGLPELKSTLFSIIQDKAHKMEGLKWLKNQEEVKDTKQNSIKMDPYILVLSAIEWEMRLLQAQQKPCKQITAAYARLKLSLAFVLKTIHNIDDKAANVLIQEKVDKASGIVDVFMRDRPAPSAPAPSADNHNGQPAESKGGDTSDPDPFAVSKPVAPSMVKPTVSAPLVVSSDAPPPYGCTPPVAIPVLDGDVNNVPAAAVVPSAPILSISEGWGYYPSANSVVVSQSHHQAQVVVDVPPVTVHVQDGDVVSEAKLAEHIVTGTQATLFASTQVMDAVKQGVEDDAALDAQSRVESESEEEQEEVRRSPSPTKRTVIDYI